MTTSTIVGKLSVAAIGVTCIAGLTSFTAAPVEAATLSSPFSFTISSGVFAGDTGNGTVSFDSTFVPATDIGVLAPGTGLLSLSLDFLGDTYTEASAIGFPNRPRLLFSNGSLFGIDFAFEVLDTDEVISLDALTSQVTSGNPGEVIGGYTPTAIPTPALLPGLIGLGLGAVTLRKRRTETAQTN